MVWKLRKWFFKNEELTATGIAKQRKIVEKIAATTVILRQSFNEEWLG